MNQSMTIQQKILHSLGIFTPRLAPSSARTAFSHGVKIMYEGLKLILTCTKTRIKTKEEESTGDREFGLQNKGQ